MGREGGGGVEAGAAVSQLRPVSRQKLTQSMSESRWPSQCPSHSLAGSISESRWPSRLLPAQYASFAAVVMPPHKHVQTPAYMLRLWALDPPPRCSRRACALTRLRGLNPNHIHASNTPQVLKKGVRFDLQIAADVPIIRRVPAAGANDPHSGQYPQYWPIIKCS